ncbi:MAG: hypothetical protein ACRDPZ_10390 [Gaiellaceae bacterium]
MKWLAPITAATCAAALAVILWLALPGTSSPTRSDKALVDAPRRCAVEPAWFVPIHEYYGCNPRITPTFDFASLYSGVVHRDTVPSSQPMDGPR